MLRLLLLGVSHHTTPIDLRERLDFASGGLDQAVKAVAGRATTGEAVVLSTCNRVELYVTCKDVDAARDDLVSFLNEYHGVPVDELTAHLYARADAEAARHLFRVAAGLDSLVIGEPQILGQIKDAYAVAADLRTAGTMLNKLFHWSFAVGKRVRSETGLAEGAVSVSYAAVSLARKIFGELKGRQVLVVGAGEMSALTAQHLRAQGVERITITSRTTSHAAQLAEQVGGAVTGWDRWTHVLADADIVITATGSDRPILTRAQVEAVARARRTRPMFLIDIAVPRNVEASAGDIEQVFLYNVDDLQAIVRDNLNRRAAEVERSEAIVREEADRFMAWLRARDAIPAVVALRERFEAIRRAELERLQPKLSALPPEARVRVDEVTRLIVEKLLLTPTEQLKALPDHEMVVAYSDALSRLFSLGNNEDLQEPAAGPAPQNPVIS